MNMDTAFAEHVERVVDRSNYAAQAHEPHLPATIPAGQPTAKNAVANIAAAIALVMEEIGIVPKGGTNKFQNYDYARIEDILQKLTPLMGKHGIIIVPSEKSRNLFDNEAVVMATYSFTLIHKSGDVWPFPLEWTGISRARDSKGGFDDKALNKCATAAQKEFLKKLFQIPVGDDPDANDTSAQSYPQGRGPDTSPSTTPSPKSIKPHPKPTAPQPPVDPETGECSPHAIQVTSRDGKFDWIAFGQSYLAALKSAKDADECDQWSEKNIGNMDALKSAEPKVYARLMSAIQTQIGISPAPPDVPVKQVTPAGTNSTTEDMI